MSNDLISDTDRLNCLMQEIESFGSVKADRYEYAVMACHERTGNDTVCPSIDDEYEGFRQMIDCWMNGGDKP